jgi:ribonuclease Z
MRVTILGSGSAVPDPVRGNPSAAVVAGGETLLFDCGERTTVNLVRAGINPMDVGHVFFTHLHWDHIADFNYLLMTVWNCGRTTPLHVWGPPGTREMTQGFLTAHAVDVAFVPAFIDRQPEGSMVGLPPREPVLVFHDVQEGVLLEAGEVTVRAAPVEHLRLLGFADADWAFRVDAEGGSVAISGDTVPCEAMVELARDVDVLIHEATFLEEVIDERAQGWTGHSGPRGAGRIARQAGAAKLVLTHLGPYDSADAAIEMAKLYYGPRRGPEIWSKILRDAASEYDGPIVLAEDAMQIALPAAAGSAPG